MPLPPKSATASLPHPSPAHHAASAAEATAPLLASHTPLTSSTPPSHSPFPRATRRGSHRCAHTPEWALKQPA
eukprot:scaffold127636_cov13-Tisochrysis_lutea.AAC.1